MKNRTFSHGFRISPLDLVILAVGLCAAVVAPRDLAIVVAMAVGHFFLFCNVFRMSRLPELIWAAVFLLLASQTLSFATPPWAVTVGVSTTLAGVLIALETRKPRYHGIAWQKLNPNLPEWSRAQENS